MPTLTLIDGFEHQNAVGRGFTGTYEKLFTDVAGTTPTFETGRTGKCIRFSCTSNTSKVSKELNSQAVAVFSFYYKINTLPSPTGTYSFFYLFTAPSYNGAARIYQQSDGKLLMQSGGNSQASSMAVNDNTWHRIDIKVDVSTSSWTVDWQIDGTAQTQVTNSGSGQTLNYLSLGWGDSITATCWMDDFIVSSASGDYPLGAHYVYALKPNGDYNYNNVGTNVIEDEDGNDISATYTAYSRMNVWPTNNGQDRVRQYATGTYFAEVNFEDTSETTIWGVEGVASLFSSYTTANSATTRIVDSTGATLTDIYAGDMSEQDTHYRRAIISAPGGSWDQTKLNGVRGRVGFATNVASLPFWNGLMLQYAVGPAAPPAGAAVDPFGMTGFWGA